MRLDSGTVFVDIDSSALNDTIPKKLPSVLAKPETYRGHTIGWADNAPIVLTITRKQVPARGPKDDTLTVVSQIDVPAVDQV
jgi:hypothetical protein